MECWDLEVVGWGSFKLYVQHGVEGNSLYAREVFTACLRHGLELKKPRSMSEVYTSLHQFVQIFMPGIYCAFPGDVGLHRGQPHGDCDLVILRRSPAPQLRGPHGCSAF